MLKSIFSPIQAWLISQGKCVGCGMPLSKGTRENNLNGEEKVTCKCGRIFMYDTSSKKYRRAILTEV